MSTMSSQQRHNHRMKNSSSGQQNRSARRKKVVKNVNRNRNRNGPNAHADLATGNQVIERGIPGFRALKYRAKLNYYEAFDLSTGAGSVGTYLFSTNGLYDPNITSTGHQPMPFDQLMLSFEHYTVTKSRISVNFRGFGALYPTCCAISLNASNTPVTNYTTLVENGLLVRSRVNAINTYDSITTLKLACDVATFGSIDDLLDNPDYKGTISSNPVEQSYFQISVWNPIDVTVTGCNVEVFIEYSAVFSEPRKNSTSINEKLAKLIISEQTAPSCSPSVSSCTEVSLPMQEDEKKAPAVCCRLRVPPSTLKKNFFDLSEGEILTLRELGLIEDYVAVPSEGDG